MTLAIGMERGKMMKRSLASLLLSAIMFFVMVHSGHCDVPSQKATGIDSMNCSTCHDKQVKSMTDPNAHASAHARKGIDKCSHCHDATELKQAHANVKSDDTNRFVKARRYPKGFCLKCHETYADLVKHTVSSKALTDTKGRVVNPHDIPKNPKHLKMDECSTCHKEHKANPDVKTYCLSCHHTGEFISCAKCHS